jgi:hypothetical protein
MQSDKLKLQRVFGIATEVSQASYVDRGGLDERLGYLLDTDRHIAIHGDSKQGKSWLRNHVLDEKHTPAVQCQVDDEPERIFQQALGTLGIQAELKTSSTTEFQGTLDLKGSAEIGKILAKAKAEGELSGGASRIKEIEVEPIGQTPADLSWVAAILRASGRRLVLEDFHYLSDEQRKRFAFMLKALGDYKLYVIVVGIWPDDHLLTYYNGDLDGRVEDVRLEWSDDSLNAVLQKGGEALNIEFSDELRSAMIKDAFGNVGLIQRLAERVCQEEGIKETLDEPRAVDVGASLEAARTAVAESMDNRYQGFADNFVRGMKRMSEGLEVYKHLLREFTSASTDDLKAGIDSRELLSRMTASGGEAIRQSDLTQALDRVDRLQDRNQPAGAYLQPVEPKALPRRPVVSVLPRVRQPDLALGRRRQSRRGHRGRRGWPGPDPRRPLVGERCKLGTRASEHHPAPATGGVRALSAASNAHARLGGRAGGMWRDSDDRAAER